jgi:hypothetical protein
MSDERDITTNKTKTNKRQKTKTTSELEELLSLRKNVRCVYLRAIAVMKGGKFRMSARGDNSNTVA